MKPKKKTPRKGKHNPTHKVGTCGKKPGLEKVFDGPKPKDLAGKITIEYKWHRPDGKPVKPAHTEALKESAWEKISELMADGYTSGELLDYIHMTSKDPEDGIEYRGWWTQTED